MDLMMQGVVLMVIGMVTVFAFLLLLIISMNGLTLFFKKFGHLFPAEEEASVKAVLTADPLAEIAVALATIRAKRG